MLDLLIKNAKHWDTEDIIDIGVLNRKIARIESNIEDDAKEVIFADQKYVLPGLIDPHVHFRTPGWEYKEDWKTGSYSAAKGGITTVLDMPNTNPGTTTNTLVKEKHFLILSNNPVIDYRLYLGAAKDNLEEIKKTKAQGVKVYLGSSTGDLLMDDYGHLEKIIDASPVPVLVHAEDEACINRHLEQVKKEYENLENNPCVMEASAHSKIRHEECAVMCVEKVVDIVRRVKKPVYFCHVSTGGEIDILRSAKKEGLPVFVEATPHHLFLSTDAYGRLGAFAKVNPPLRAKNSVLSLWKGVFDGTVDTIGTDHAPHTIEEKEQCYKDAPSGMPGLETSLPLLLNAVNDGRLTLKKVVELTVVNSANIFGLFDKRGMDIGTDADIVIIDMNLEQTVSRDDLATKCQWSPFEGFKLKGWPVTTISRGKVVFNM